MILSIDTGAKVTIISEEIWKEIEQPSLSPPRHRLRAPDAKPIKDLQWSVNTRRPSS